MAAERGTESGLEEALDSRAPMLGRTGPPALRVATRRDDNRKALWRAGAAALATLLAAGAVLAWRDRRASMGALTSEHLDAAHVVKQQVFGTPAANAGGAAGDVYPAAPAANAGGAAGDAYPAASAPADYGASAYPGADYGASAYPDASAPAAAPGGYAPVAAAPAAPSMATTRGASSLYCVTLVLPYGNELELVRMQLEKRLSLFACNEYAVFSNITLPVGPDSASGGVLQTLPIGGSLQVLFGGKWGTALNTDIFVRLWQAVSRSGRYQYQDWTVKLDADCVFIAEKLRVILSPITSPGAEYLNNCKWGLHGPIEVISATGMSTFLTGMDTVCESIRKAAMQWQAVHWKPAIHRYGGDDKEHSFGEDQYLRRCLRQLSIVQVDEFEMLSEPACSLKPPDCASQSACAFHPFKQVSTYQSCLDIAMR